MRSAGADAVEPGALPRRRDERRMGGEAQVIVARERQKIAAVDFNANALRAFEQAPAAHEIFALQALQIEVKIRERHFRRGKAGRRVRREVPVTAPEQAYFGS